jgi:hypothetical protein
MVSATLKIMSLVFASCITWPFRRLWMRRPLAPGRQFVGRHQHGPKPPVPVEVLADGPLRRALLVVAHAHVVEAAVAEDVLQRVGSFVWRGTFLPITDGQFGFVVELGRDTGQQPGWPWPPARTRRGRRTRVVRLLAAAFLGVVVVVQAQADVLPGSGTSGASVAPAAAGAGLVLAARAAAAWQVDAGLQRSAQVGGHLRLASFRSIRSLPSTTARRGAPSRR